MLNFQDSDFLQGNNGLRAIRWMDELYTTPFFKKKIKNVDNFIGVCSVAVHVHLSSPFLIPFHFLQQVPLLFLHLFKRVPLSFIRGHILSTGIQ